MKNFGFREQREASRSGRKKRSKVAAEAVRRNDETIADGVNDQQLEEASSADFAEVKLKISDEDVFDGPADDCVTPNPMYFKPDGTCE